MCIGAAHVQSMSVEVYWLDDAYVVAALHLLVRAPNVGSEMVKQKHENCVCSSVLGRETDENAKAMHKIMAKTFYIFFYNCTIILICEKWK